jgi:hypothetical protein
MGRDAGDCEVLFGRNGESQLAVFSTAAIGMDGGGIGVGVKL